MPYYPGGGSNVSVSPYAGLITLTKTPSSDYQTISLTDDEIQNNITYYTGSVTGNGLTSVNNAAWQVS